MNCEKDGRATNVEIARKLGINVATVAKKINSIIEKGMIVINAMPDPIIMGYRVKALIGLEAEPKQIDTVCSFLQQDPHVHMVSSCLGRFDILAIVFFENIVLLQEYLKNDLPKINGINHFDVFFMSDYKRDLNTMEDPSGTGQIPALDDLDKKNHRRTYPQRKTELCRHGGKAANQQTDDFTKNNKSPQR